MVVIDASALVVLMLGGAPAPARDRLRGVPLAAPHLIDLEVASTLRRQVHLGRLSGDEAEVRVEMLRVLALGRHPHAPLLPRIWELRDNLSAYDAAYVALAELLGVPLVTTDARLARASGIACEIELLAI